MKEKLPEYLLKLKQQYGSLPIKELDVLIIYLQNLRSKKTDITEDKG